jgi:hypothetical protein
MAATIIQTTPETPETTEKPRGFSGVCCLRCGEENIRLYVADVTAFQCTDCEAEFTPADIEATLAAWSKLIAWVRTAPVIEE